MRKKLASIQKITKIEPIEGNDQFELAHVLGKQCVVKKRKLEAGSLGVYIAVGSFLPICPEFEFLRPSCYKNTEQMGEGFLLSEQEFGGHVSQGLVFPISYFKKLYNECWTIGDDVTELLEIREGEDLFSDNNL